MPIYDYVCATCRHLTEVIHGIHEPGPRFCPACGAEGTMRKAMSSPSVHFKGSGWAKKDRSSSSGVRTKAAAGASSESRSGDAGSSRDKDAASPGPAASSSEPAAGSSEPTARSED